MHISTQCTEILISKMFFKKLSYIISVNLVIIPSPVCNINSSTGHYILFLQSMALHYSRFAHVALYDASHLFLRAVVEH